MAEVPLALQVRLTRHGVNHVKVASKPKTECGLSIDEDLGAREDERLCCDCRRAVDPYMQRRTYRIRKRRRTHA